MLSITITRNTESCYYGFPLCLTLFVELATKQAVSTFLLFGCLSRKYLHQLKARLFCQYVDNLWTSFRLTAVRRLTGGSEVLIMHNNLCYTSWIIHNMTDDQMVFLIDKNTRDMNIDNFPEDMKCEQYINTLQLDKFYVVRSLKNVGAVVMMSLKYSFQVARQDKANCEFGSAVRIPCTDQDRVGITIQLLG